MTVLDSNEKLVIDKETSYKIQLEENKVKINSVKEIFNDLENCIKNKKPFSLIRFGDGMLKIIFSILYNNSQSIKTICEKEGLPEGEELLKIFELWGYYARKANYIDSPEVYFSNTFWSRTGKGGRKISRGTKNKLLKWKELYYNSEFDNENYCNPEINFLMLIKMGYRKTLLDMMKKRKVCMITNYPKVIDKFKDYNIKIVEIVGKYNNQFYCSFKKVIKKIEEKANDYDLWIVSAGELGRVYTGLIKECGGRAFDIGSVVEFWLREEIPIRLKPYIKMDPNNSKQIKLYKEGKKYGDYL